MRYFFAFLFGFFLINSSLYAAECPIGQWDDAGTCKACQPAKNLNVFVDWPALDPTGVVFTSNGGTNEYGCSWTLPCKDAFNWPILEGNLSYNGTTFDCASCKVTVPPGRWHDPENNNMTLFTKTTIADAFPFCGNGFWCAGGEFGFENIETCQGFAGPRARGCPQDFPSSGVNEGFGFKPATSSEECYRACTVEDVPLSSTVVGRVTAGGENVCTVQGCLGSNQVSANRKFCVPCNECSARADISTACFPSSVTDALNQCAYGGDFCESGYGGKFYPRGSYDDPGNIFNSTTYDMYCDPNPIKITYAPGNGGVGTPPPPQNFTFQARSDVDDAVRALQNTFFTNPNGTFRGWICSTTEAGANRDCNNQVKSANSFMGNVVYGGDVTLTALWTDCPACVSNPGTTCVRTIGADGVCSYTTTCQEGYENLSGGGTYNPTCEPGMVDVEYRNCAESPIGPGMWDGSTEPKKVRLGESFTVPDKSAFTPPPGYVFNMLDQWYFVSNGTRVYNIGQQMSIHQTGGYFYLTCTSGCWGVTLDHNGGTHPAGDNKIIAPFQRLPTNFNSPGEQKQYWVLGTSPEAEEGFIEGTACPDFTNVRGRGRQINTWPLRPGHVFKGYFTERVGGTQIISDGMNSSQQFERLTILEPYENSTIYAQWEPCPTCTGAVNATCVADIVNNSCGFKSECLPGYYYVSGRDTATPICEKCGDNEYCENGYRFDCPVGYTDNPGEKSSECDCKKSVAEKTFIATPGGGTVQDCSNGTWSKDRLVGYCEADSCASCSKQHSKTGFANGLNLSLANVTWKSNANNEFGCAWEATCNSLFGGTFLEGSVSYAGSNSVKGYTDLKCETCTRGIPSGYHFGAPGLDLVNALSGAATICPNGRYCPPGRTFGITSQCTGTTYNPGEVCPVSHPFSDPGSDEETDCYDSCEAMNIENAESVSGRRQYPDTEFDGCTIVCLPDYFLVDGQCVQCRDCEAGNGAVCEFLGMVDGVCKYKTECLPGHSPIQNNGEYNPSCPLVEIKIVYNSNGGTGSVPPYFPTKFSLGSPTMTPPNPFTKGGSSFSGWVCTGGLAGLCSGTPVIPGVTNLGSVATSGTITLTAQWTENTCDDEKEMSEDGEFGGGEDGESGMTEDACELI